LRDLDEGEGEGGEEGRLSMDAFVTVEAEGCRNGWGKRRGGQGGEYPLTVPRGAWLVRAQRFERAFLNDQHAVKCITEWMKV
jgi:hypothetical protein